MEIETFQLPSQEHNLIAAEIIKAGRTNRYDQNCYPRPLTASPRRKWKSRYSDTATLGIRPSHAGDKFSICYMPEDEWLFICEIWSKTKRGGNQGREEHKVSCLSRKTGRILGLGPSKIQKTNTNYLAWDPLHMQGWCERSWPML